MLDLHANEQRPHHVTVLYQDGNHSFWLEPGATLAELAVHVGGLDALHNHFPLSIDIHRDSNISISAVRLPPKIAMN